MRTDLKTVKHPHVLEEIDKEVYEEFKAEFEAEINKSISLFPKTLLNYRTLIINIFFQRVFAMTRFLDI